MRIIAGQFRRRLINAPPGNATRPTTDRAREAMFNMVEARLDLRDSNVLDLYSGSGALGLEALSRGALHVDMVERDPTVLAVSKANAESLGPDLNISFYASSVSSWIKAHSGSRYELVLADPPYESVEAVELLKPIVSLLSPGGLFIFEHPRHLKVDTFPGFMGTRTYGKSAVSLFSQPIED